MHTRLCMLTLMAAAAVGCSDTPASLEPLAPEGPSSATITLNGGTSTTIQNAINSASAGDVIVLNGTFTMNSNVSLKSNITIRGGSNNLLTCTTSVDYFLGKPSGALQNVLIEGLNGDGNGCGTTGSFIRIYNGGTVSNVTIRDNTIQDFDLHGIQIASDASGAQTIANLLVEDNTISDIAHDAIQVGENTACCVHDNVDIIRNTIARTGKAGVGQIGFGIHVLHTNDVDILRNRVIDTCEEGIRLTNSEQARIKSNYVSGVLFDSACDASGIKSDGSTNVVIQYDTVRAHTYHPHIEVTGGSGVDILNNLIEAAGAKSVGPKAIKVWPTANKHVEDVLISGNTIRDTREAVTIFTQPAGKNVHYVDVVGNTFEGVCDGVRAHRLDGSAGYIRHLDIDGNEMSKVGSIGCGEKRTVYLYGVGYVTATNNEWWTNNGTLGDHDAFTQDWAWNVGPLTSNTERSDL